jgi:competence protein ComEC
MTLPLILLTFSQLSIIALVANALVVPLVPLAMLLAAVAGAAGAIAPQFAGWLAYPAKLLLTYMLDVVHMLSNIPSVLIHRSISLAYMVAIYAGVLVLLAVSYHKLPKNKKLMTEEVNAITP